MSTKLLRITRENLLDAFTNISMGVYSITDRQTGEELCSMKRKVLESVLKESWIVVDSSGNEVGTLSEDIPASMMLHRLSDVRSAFNRGSALGERNRLGTMILLLALTLNTVWWYVFQKLTSTQSVFDYVPSGSMRGTDPIAALFVFLIIAFWPALTVFYLARR